MTPTPRSNSEAPRPPVRLDVAWSAGEAFAIVMGSHVALIVSSVVVFGIGGWSAGSVPLWAQVVALGPYWLVALAASHRVMTRAGVPFADWVCPDRRAKVVVAHTSIGLGTGVATSLFVVPAVYAPLHQWWGTSPEELEAPARALVDQADGSLGIAALVLMTCIGAPVVEEVLYRGVLQTGLVRLGGAVSVVASSAVFAAIHFQLLQFVGLFVIGVVLAVLYRWSGGLAAPIAAHLGFNAVTVVMLLTQR